MSLGSKIEWCHASINFWWGCTEVSPGCANCYARERSRYASRRLFGRFISWGRNAPRAERLQAARAEAEKLNRKAKKLGVRYRVFTNSMSDWLDDAVPIEWLKEMLRTIYLTPHLDWLLLTKRPQNFRDRVGSIKCAPGEDDFFAWLLSWLFAGSTIPTDDGPFPITPPHNLWVGTSVENQELA